MLTKKIFQLFPVIAALTLAIALFVFKPTLILNSTHLLALTLFNT